MRWLSRSYLLALAGLLVLPAIVWAGWKSGCSAPDHSDELQATVERRVTNALIADLDVQLARPAPIYVEYGSDQAGWLRTPTLPAATSHQLPLLRLIADTAYEVRVFSLREDGSCPSGVAVANFVSGPLPPSLRHSVNLSSGQAGFDLMLMENHPIATDSEDRDDLLLVQDAAGRVVWYYVIPSDPDLPGNAWTAFGVQARANGNLVFHAGGYYGFEEITMDGRRVRHVPARTGTLVRTTHHDFTELPDGRLLFLAREERMVPRADGGAPRLVRGDTLNTLDLETGEAKQVWTVFDMLDPNQRPDHWRGMAEDAEDWTHANTVSLGLRGNVLLSLRSMDQVISLSPDLKALEWRLGGPGGQFEFADPTDRFFGQHTVHEVAPNRLLMFDNGVFRPEGEYSRGLELELDFASMTARKVWEYRHNPDYFSSRISSAYRLPNGNTLINFGYWENERNGVGPSMYGLKGRGSSRPVLAVEARPDGSVDRG
jgi:hypothetical protein